MILLHDLALAFLPIPPESLSFLFGLSTSHPRHQVPSHQPSLQFVFDFLFPSSPFLPVPAPGGFHLFHSVPQTCGFRLFRFTLLFQSPHIYFFCFVTAVHEASDVVLSMSFIIFEDSELTSSTWKTSTAQRKGCPMSYRSRSSQSL